ncbi:MAG TPA: amidase family protein, partial [Casimicrobiaceae bacterium]|nr:amidase family protein [Casimicrobiaceae bacterium]
HRDALSPRLVEIIEQGRRVQWSDYIVALDAAAKARRATRTAFETHDVLLSPSAPGEAPIGIEATGDPIFNRGVTMLGLPAVTLPAGHGGQQMPLGVQLIGGWDRDRELLAIARWIHTRLRSEL